MAQFLLMGILVLYVMLRIAHVMRLRNDAVLGLLLVGVAVSRICIGLVNHYLGPLPGAQYDAVMFDETARSMASIQAGAVNFVLEVGRYGYSSLLALFYLLGGYHFFIPTLVNLVFTLEFVIIVYTIGSHWGGDKVGRISAAFAGFYPTSIIYTSVPLREAPLLWAFALYVKVLLDYFDGTSRLFGPRLFAALGMLIWLHDGFALAVFLIPIAMWFKHRDVPVWKRAAFMAIGLMLIMTVFVVALSFVDFRKMPADPAMLLDPTYLSQMRDQKSGYGAGYGTVEASWAGILRSWPLLVFAFVAAPFPIWWSGFGEFPKVLEGVLSLTVVSIACYGAIRGRINAEPRKRLLLAMFLYMVIVFAMGTGNTGIAARHRAKFIWMPAMLVTLGWSASRQKSPASTDPLPGGIPTAGSAGNLPGRV